MPLLLQLKNCVSNNLKLNNVTAAWLALIDAGIDAKLENISYIHINIKLLDSNYYRVGLYFDLNPEADDYLLGSILWSHKLSFVTRYYSYQGWWLVPEPVPEVKNIIDIVFKELGIK